MNDEVFYPSSFMPAHVEPVGTIEDDPNLTDKKFPGNPTRSYRSREPLRVIGEVVDWQGHSPEELKAMKDGLERLKQQGVGPITKEEKWWKKRDDFLTGSSWSRLLGPG